MNCPEIITDATRLRSVVDSALNHRRVALDLESNGFHRYPERICLVQLAVSDRIYLVDPLAVDDMKPLGELLAAPSVEKIFHAADYDIRSLDRDWSFSVSPLFDTSIAAAFVGSSRLGLDTLLKECLDVEIFKSKRLQRADWTRRPLSNELQAYAAGDVRYLERLATVFNRKLADLGRTEWVREECERLSRVRFSAPDKDGTFLSLKGSRGLDGRGLAILRSVYSFRDREARRRDRPPFKIFSSAAMLALAASPRSDLASVKGIGVYGRGRGAHRLRKALNQGMEAEPVQRPQSQSPGRVRVSPKERQIARGRLSKLKDWRKEQAHRLGLGVGQVWSGTSLERISIDPSGFREELRHESVRNWQRGEFSDSLHSLVTSL